MKASRARVLNRFSAERALRVRVGDLWTRYVAEQAASYVAVVAYGRSFPAGQGLETFHVVVFFHKIWATQARQ